MHPISPMRTTLAAIALMSIHSFAFAEESATGTAQRAPEAQAAQASLAPELVKPMIESGATLKPATIKAPMTKEQKAIFDIQESGRTQVLELNKQAESLTDGPARRALEQKIVQVKRDTEVQVLRTIAAQALQRGDLPAARTANDAIEQMLHPKAPQASLSQRPAPGSASDR
jgi:hypothetical protein